MAVTSADVARRCGVSRHTVNGILGKRAHLFAAETRRKVEEAARDMGYRPQASGRILRTGRSRCLALLCDPDWSRTHLPLPLLYALMSAADAIDMHVAVSRIPDLSLPERVPLLRESLMADGVLLNYHQPMPALHEIVATAGLPAVWLNVPGDHGTISPDDRMAGRVAAELLLEGGHHPAWLDPWPPELGTMPVHHSRPARLQGYTEALTAAGLAPRIITPDARLRAGEEHRWFAEILRRPDRPTGIIAVDGEAAGASAMLGAAEAGLAVPRDLSVVVIDGQPASAGTRMTTVLLPWSDIAHEAVDMLVQLIERPRSEATARLVRPTVHGSDLTLAPPPKPCREGPSPG